MGRAIEFRVWDETAGKFRDLAVYNVKNGKVVVRFPIETLKKGEYQLEQYTGLKDKNGKEIYEGDIVRFYEVYCAVVWDEDRACFDLETGQNRGAFVFNKTSLAKMEVIGNIHEPPKDFRPEHLKRMGVFISKGGEE